MRFLKGLLKTSSGCTRLVNPGGSLTRTVLLFCNRRLTSFVCWAMSTPPPNGLLLEPSVAGLVKFLHDLWLVHFLIITASHLALFESTSLPFCLSYDCPLI